MVSKLRMIWKQVITVQLLDQMNIPLMVCCQCRMQCDSSVDVVNTSEASGFVSASGATEVRAFNLYVNLSHAWFLNY